LEEVQEEMRETLETTGTVITADPLPTIIGSANQLSYLIKNIISNGVKFQLPGARPNLTIRFKLENNYLKIAFTDNGIGIEPAHHKRIFEIFRRLHHHTAYEGTGMGLAICKKIMEKHGGKITVESEAGNGTTFTCWFPAALSTKR
jgi:signal transduction histidine kinase